MFHLSRFRHSVRLPPSSFKLPLPEAISQSINRSMANSVFPGLGLVVGLYDIINIGDSFILEGCSVTQVEFRAVVFRPMVEEVLVGRIKSCNRSEGVFVSMGFFDDIVIPPHALQHPYRFDENEQVWVWEYPTEEELHHDLYMDVGEEIRFRVTSETFLDTSPNASGAPKVPSAEPPRAGSNTLTGEQQHQQEEKKIPYMIHASVHEPGLGLLSWWNS